MVGVGASMRPINEGNSDRQMAFPVSSQPAITIKKKKKSRTIIITTKFIRIQDSGGLDYTNLALSRATDL
jgi:hypothetical protein